MSATLNQKTLYEGLKHVYFLDTNPTHCAFIVQVLLIHFLQIDKSVQTNQISSVANTRLWNLTRFVQQDNLHISKVLCDFLSVNAIGRK